MSTGLSPKMKNLDLNKEIIMEEFWGELFDLLRRLTTAIPKKNRNDWKEKCKAFLSKYTKRTDA
jgi:hypothetical protein